MTEMPKRIWAGHDLHHSTLWSDRPPMVGNTRTEYVRADIVEELAGALKELMNVVLHHQDDYKPDYTGCAIERAISAIEAYKGETSTRSTTTEHGPSASSIS
jgi:hypothetical protein